MIRAPFRSTTALGLAPVSGAYELNHAALVSNLTDLLGPASAAMFADFQTDELGQGFDWYGPEDVDVRIIAFGDLALPDQQDLLSRLRVATDEIRAGADRLEQRGAAAYAMMLRDAVHFPDEGYLHAVTRKAGGAATPLLVHWGWRRAEVAPHPVDLTGKNTIVSNPHPRIEPDLAGR